jgi:hypothetical protein
MPSTPEVLQARERAPTPSLYVVFTFELAIESINELGGVSTLYNICRQFKQNKSPHQLITLSNIVRIYIHKSSGIN